jgi:Fe-S oxidoreductase
MLAVLAVLDETELDYIALAGGSLCCGSKYLEQNDIQKASDAADALIAALSAFKPKTVAFWCGTCAWLVRDIYPKFADISFQVRHLTQLLNEYLDALSFTKHLNTTLTIHDACNLGRKVGDFDSIRSLMRAIPGVEIREMDHNREKALCCGGNAYAHFPRIAVQMKQARLTEARNTGAEIMTYACHGCHHVFCMEENHYGVEVRSYISLLAKALGIEFEDKMKAFLKLKDVDKVMEELGGRIGASGFSTEEIRNALAVYMNKDYYSPKG